MINLVTHLNKRRKIIIFLIICFASLSILFHFTYTIVPLNYFDGKYNQLFIYGLITYKLIELPILYYILLHRHTLKLKNNDNYNTAFQRLTKQSKILFFLILQGNTIFGVISYKLSGDVLFFLLFMLIALLTTILVKPNRIFL